MRHDGPRGRHSPSRALGLAGLALTLAACGGGADKPPPVPAPHTYAEAVAQLALTDKLQAVRAYAPTAGEMRQEFETAERPEPVRSFVEGRLGRFHWRPVACGANDPFYDTFDACWRQGQLTLAVTTVPVGFPVPRARRDAHRTTVVVASVGPGGPLRADA